MKTLAIFSVKESNFYEYSTLDKVATEEKDVKSTLGSLKLRNMNNLIFGQIDINSIRNEKSNLYIHFLWVNFVYLDTQYHSELAAQEREELYDLVEC